jgi:hypothetical protein
MTGNINFNIRARNVPNITFVRNGILTTRNLTLLRLLLPNFPTMPLSILLAIIPGTNTERYIHALK